jgi:hypothetical protein
VDAHNRRHHGNVTDVIRLRIPPALRRSKTSPRGSGFPLIPSGDLPDSSGCRQARPKMRRVQTCVCTYDIGRGLATDAMYDATNPLLSIGGYGPRRGCDADIRSSWPVPGIRGMDRHDSATVTRGSRNSTPSKRFGFDTVRTIDPGALPPVAGSRTFPA